MYIALLKYLTDSGRLYHQLLAPARQLAGLTQTELDILLFLSNHPDCNTASDIVSLRRLVKSNVSVGVKSLEAKGLLVRQPDEKDRRVERLILTPAAGPTVEAGRRGQEVFEDILLRGFSAQDRDMLANLLLRIQRNLAQPLKLRN